MVTKKILFLCIPLALAGCNSIDASAGTGYGDYYYHDVARPRGRSRSLSALQADNVTCIRRSGHRDRMEELSRIKSDPRYQSCMSGHGWRFMAYRPPRAAPREDSGSAYVAPPDNYAHDGYSDAMQTQQMINDMNTGIAAEAAATAANSQAAADALAAASN